jgi:hypothetical protein
MILIGIDPGVTTGVAFWSTDDKKLLRVKSGTFIEMYSMLCDVFLSNDMNVPLSRSFFFRIEDARKRKWYGSKSNAKAQGAGSVKRDSKIWQEVCEFHDWDYHMIHPIKGATKWDSDKFNRVTGWEGRTNQNARDAAMMVYGLNKIN